MERTQFRNQVESTRAEIRRYAGLRPVLLKEHLSLSGTNGSPWTAECDRDVKPGAFRFTTLVDVPCDAIQKMGVADGVENSTDEGNPKRTSLVMENFAACGSVALIENDDPFAPIIDFRLVDRNGNRPEPGTHVRQIELNIGFLLARMLTVVKGLHIALFGIEKYAAERRVDADTIPLTKFRLQLPEFPFVPPALLGDAGRQDALASERQLIDDAILTLERIAVEVCVGGD